jgi:thiamine pyrophosphokinase
MIKFCYRLRRISQQDEIWAIKENLNHLQNAKINIFVQADTHTRKHIEQASWLCFSVHTKPYCNEPWRNWKKFHPAWTFLQAMEATEMYPNLCLLHSSSLTAPISKEKSLHIPPQLETSNFSASNGWIGRLKKCNNAYWNLSGEKCWFRLVNYQLCKKLKVMTSVT